MFNDRIFIKSQKVNNAAVLISVRFETMASAPEGLGTGWPDVTFF